MFLGTIPVVLLYWFAYFVLVKVPVAVDDYDGDDKTDERKPLLNDTKLSGTLLLSTLDNNDYSEYTTRPLIYIY